MGSVILCCRDALAVGQTDRFLIGIDWNLCPEGQVSVRVKNRTKLSGKVAYLLGPFVLYCDCRPLVPSETGLRDRPPIFKTNIEPQKKFHFVLNSQDATVSEDGKCYWIVDIVSDILFSTESKVDYEIIASTDPHDLSKHKYMEDHFENGHTIQKIRNDDLSKFMDVGGNWLKSHEKPQNKHLVIITHGMYSNVPNDMMYIMEKLRETQMDDEHLIIDGYRGNVCQTELGIKALGIRLAKYIVDEVYNKSITKISFIGHSLGGLIQTFAIAYISLLHPWFFERVQPVNFIAMATPFLGLYTDIGNYAKKLLSSGALGQTGEDLRFHKRMKEKNLQILFLLSGEPAHSILQKFVRRTIYANAINDGVVPLVSSSLLFLRYNKILSDINMISEDNTSTDIEMDINSISNWNDFKTSAKYYEYKKFYPKSKVFRRVSFNNTVGNLVTPEAPKDFNILETSDVIIHDELYEADDVAAPDELTLMLYKGKYTFDKYQLQELIARRWHSGKTWRKVLVTLGGDAHNSINVRRRYGNAYGWKVVEHMISTHFTTPSTAVPVVSPPKQEHCRTEPNIEFAWLMKEEKTRCGFLTKTSKTMNPLGRWI